MSDKDLFAPPTKEEKAALFAPPSKEEMDHFAPPQSHELASLASSVEPGKLESALRGAAQGATLGYADELAGLLESAVSDKTYEQARNESRHAYEAAEKANPLTYTAGNIGGGLATAVIPGLGELSLGKAAALGAATGLGSSNAEDVTGAAKDALIGGAIGGATFGVGTGIGKLFQKSAEGAEKAGSQFIERSMKIDPKKAAGVQNAFTKGESGEVVKKSAKDLYKGIGKTLEEEGVVGLESPTASYDKIQAAIGKRTKELAPLLDNAQQGLEEASEEAINKATKGPLEDKVRKSLDSLVEGSTDKQQAKYGPLMQEEFGNYLEKIQEAGHDLNALQALKKEVTQDATDYSSKIYSQGIGTPNDPIEKGYKAVGGLLKEHIEQLADVGAPGASELIKQRNSTLQDLYEGLKGVSKQLVDEQRPVGKMGTFLDLAKTGPGAAAGMAVAGPVGAAVGAGLQYAGTKALEGATGLPTRTMLGRVAGKALLNDGVQNTLQTVAKQAPQLKSQQLIEHQVRRPFDEKPKYAGSDKGSSVTTGLYTASDDELRNSLTHLRQINDPSLDTATGKLEEALNKGDTRAKNQALFLIANNPSYRAAMAPTKK